MRLAPIVLALLLAAGSAIADTASKHGFTQKVATLIEARGADGIVRVKGPLEIQIRGEDGRERTLYLDNLYRGLGGSDEEQAAQIDAFLAPLFAGSASELSANQLTSVLPVVRDESFVTHLKKTLQTPGNPVLTHRLVADLWVLYVLDLPDQMRFLSLADAYELGASESVIRTRARENLQSRLADVSVRSEGPFYVVRLDDNFESSLLVLDDFWRQIEAQVPGKLVAAIPNRNVLLFTSAEDVAAVASLRQVAEQLVTEYSYPISRHLLLRQEGRWSRFE